MKSHWIIFSNLHLKNFEQKFVFVLFFLFLFTFFDVFNNCLRFLKFLVANLQHVFSGNRRPMLTYRRQCNQLIKEQYTLYCVICQSYHVCTGDDEWECEEQLRGFRGGQLFSGGTQRHLQLHLYPRQSVLTPTSFT